MRIPRPAWRRDLSGPTPPWVAQVLRGLACALVAALIALPVAAEQAVEQVRFDDHLGTFPVEVGLCHDGRSTLDTGLFGKVFWGQTGSYGFGAYARATGPPEAGGTLASYVDPKFIQANVALIDDPDRTVDAYAAELSSDLRQHLLRDELLAATLGGGLLFLLVPRGPWPGVSRRRQLATTTALAAVGAVLSVGIAGQLFATWDCNDPSGTVYSIPGVDNLYFGSPETREIAAQVKPFIDKNTRRIEQQGNAYEDAATASFTSALARRSAELHPRSGERLVIAEADPQGSFVGVHVRTALYDALATALGPDPISLRTIAGDVSSNGTVAEAAYIKAEAKVGGEVPVAAVGGDHDSTRTWQQMVDDGIELPDLDTVELGDLQVSGANDREHKALFGVLVTNEEGTSEEELGHVCGPSSTRTVPTVPGAGSCSCTSRTRSPATSVSTTWSTCARWTAASPRRTTTASPTSRLAWSTSATCTPPTGRGCCGTPTATRSPGPSSTSSVRRAALRTRRPSAGSPPRCRRR